MSEIEVDLLRMLAFFIVNKLSSLHLQNNQRALGIYANTSGLTEASLSPKGATKVIKKIPAKFQPFYFVKLSS